MLTRELLEEQYVNQRRSMAEIARLNGCSLNMVVYWMREHGIKRRSMSDAVYAWRNPTEPFNVPTAFTTEQETLRAVAIGLYLGEGFRRSTSEVRLGNSDPLVLKFFIRFLREVCGVVEERLHVSLVIHPDVDPTEAERFWSEQLRVPLARFQKTTILKPRGKGTYRHRCAYGVASVGVCSTKLRKMVEDWISEYARVAQWQSTAMVRPLPEFDSPLGLHFDTKGQK